MNWGMVIEKTATGYSAYVSDLPGEQTKYAFGDHLALIGESKPQHWETGKVVGL